MNKIRLGSVLLLFTVMILCIITLAILGVTTARADEKVAQKYADNVTNTYEIESLGTLWLSKVTLAIDEYGDNLTAMDLPEGTKISGNEIATTLNTESRSLEIRLTLTEKSENQKGYKITTWENTALRQETGSWNLWGSDE